jgi:hypothetical protein
MRLFKVAPFFLILLTMAVPVSANNTAPPPQQPQQQPSAFRQKITTITEIMARMGLVAAEHAPAGATRAVGRVLNNPVLGMAEPFLNPENAANIKETVEAAYRQQQTGTMNKSAAKQLQELEEMERQQFAPPPSQPSPPPAPTAALSPPNRTPPASWSNPSPPQTTVAPPPSANAAPASPPPVRQPQTTYVAPPQPQPVQVAPGQVAPVQVAPVQVAPVQVAMVQPAAPRPAPTPGGISLSFAAAANLAIKLDLEAFHAEEGRLTFGGREGNAQLVDAPLFMTALRLACERSSPYMSLDADDGAAWTRSVERAGDEIWPRIRDDFGYNAALAADAKEELKVRSVSLRRDYPKIWSEMQAKYPALKTRLVFKPDWLAQTRFGEIMYTADVLLKELSSGVPMVKPSKEVRATLVDGYQSSKVREVLRGLVDSVGDIPPERAAHSSYRLWFDIAPDPKENTNEFKPSISMLDGEHGKDDASLKLQELMKNAGYRDPSTRAMLTRAVAVADNSLDLSRVWPQMFVRGHDIAQGKDVRSMNADLIKLAVDVNQRISAYAAKYDELRQLTEVFRLYVAAVAMAERSPDACQSIRGLPLLKTERPAKPLPEFHPTEVTYTVASFTAGTKDGKRRWHYQTSSFDGGVAIRAANVLGDAKSNPLPTPVTREIADQSKTRFTDPAWQAQSGRGYFALTLDDPQLLQKLKTTPNLDPADAIIKMHPQLAVLLDQQPAGPKAAPPAGRPNGGPGMLDDVDDSEGATVIVR